MIEVEKTLPGVKLNDLYVSKISNVEEDKWELEEYNKSFKLIVLLCISFFFCLTIKDKKIFSGLFVIYIE